MAYIEIYQYGNENSLGLVFRILFTCHSPGKQTWERNLKIKKEMKEETNEICIEMSSFSLKKNAFENYVCKI